MRRRMQQRVIALRWFKGCTLEWDIWIGFRCLIAIKHTSSHLLGAKNLWMQNFLVGGFYLLWFSFASVFGSHLPLFPRHTSDKRGKSFSVVATYMNERYLDVVPDASVPKNTVSLGSIAWNAICGSSTSHWHYLANALLVPITNNH